MQVFSNQQVLKLGLERVQFDSFSEMLVVI
jgi:hypothetical protein